MSMTLPDPTRSWRSWTAYFSERWKQKSLKFLYKTAPASILLYQDILNSFENMAFHVKTVFCHLFPHFKVKLRNHLIFSQSNCFTWKNVRRDIRMFRCKNVFVQALNLFFLNLPSSILLLLKFGPGQAEYSWLKPFKLEYKFYTQF